MTQEVNEAVVKAKAVVGGEAGTAGVSSVHYDRPLSDYSVQVRQEDTEFQAASIVGNLNSLKRQDQYYFYEPAYFMVNQVAVRAEGTEAAQAKYGVSRRSYTTVVYGLKQPVTDELDANADQPIEDVFLDATRFITRQFLLNKEKQLATSILATGVWATDWAGQDGAIVAGDTVVAAGAFQKFSAATAKPLQVLDLAIQTVQLKSGLRPNTMVMTRSVFTVLKRNSTILTTKLYTNQNNGSDDAILDTIASHLGLAQGSIYILDVIEPSTSATVDGATYKITTDTNGYASATEGDDATTIANQFIGGDGILLMYVDRNTSGRYSATAAVCAQWTGLYPDGGDLGNTQIKRYREERLNSTMVEGNTAFSYHIVAPALGIYLNDVT